MLELLAVDLARAWRRLTSKAGVGGARRHQQVVGLEERRPRAGRTQPARARPRRAGSASPSRPCSVFQMMSGLIRSRCVFELHFAVDHEVLRAQHQKRLRDRADVGRRLLDDGSPVPRSGAPPCGTDLARLAVHRDLAAEVRREGDALGALALGDRVGERDVPARRRSGDRAGRSPPSRRGTAPGPATLRAIGPCTDSGEYRLLDVPRVTRPGDGRRPTTEQ